MVCVSRFLIAAALALAATPALAQADARAESKAHFDAGLSLFKAEKYEAAALELEASVRLYATKGALFNLASVYKVLSRYDDALAAIERMETELADRLDPEMRAAAAKMKKEIEGLAARLDIVVTPGGASVTVDGRKAGRTPLGKPLLVDPGVHVVRAELAGYAASEREVQVISRQTAKVELALERADAPAAAGPAPAAAGEAPRGEPATPEGDVREAPAGTGPATEPARRPLPPGWFWAGLGATVAFGGAALGMELAVRANKDDLTSDAELEKYERVQKAGIAFVALTGAAAVTTAVLAAFTDFGGGGEEKPVAVGITPVGAAIEGRF